MDVYAFETVLVRRLLAWGGASVACGAVLGLAGQATGRPALRAFGIQTAGWGAIDVALAAGGAIRVRRILADPPAEPGAGEAEAGRLRNVLAINGVLDILYVAGGVAVAAGRGRTDAAARGHGLAAAVQGAFLFAFDLWHAARVPNAGGAGAPEIAVGVTGTEGRGGEVDAAGGAADRAAGSS